MADLEVNALIAIQRPKLNYDAVVASVTNTDRVINRWIVSKKTGLARGMFQRIIENSEKALSTIHQAIYFPSKFFRKRFIRIKDSLRPSIMATLKIMAASGSFSRAAHSRVSPVSGSWPCIGGISTGLGR